MLLKYAEFERLMERMFDLSQSQRPALKGRFKYLKKLGLKQEAGEGRSRYDVEFLLCATLVLELIDAGCSPARARRMISTHWPRLVRNIASAWADVLAWESGETQGVRPFLWTILPHALCEVGRKYESTGGEDFAENSLLTPVEDRAGDVALETLLEWSPDGPMRSDRHAIVISLSHLLGAMCSALAGVAPDLVSDFRRELAAFGSASRVVVETTRKRRTS